ncbi:MAG TPA: TMEM175 family protein [Streptosporangiaceae bacterium]|nr:TMEM175 family protein [Streptosporangiaceae bacterium]
MDQTPDETVRAERAEVDLLAAERLTFFSDAVVAIAITLLALGLPVPRGATNAELLRAAGDYLDDYLAFLISFAVIGSHWFAHHRTFRYVTRLDGRLGKWNMLWLLMIITTPFATRVLTSEGAFESRFIFYAAVQVLAGLFSLLMIREIARHGLLRASAPPDLIRVYRGRAAAVMGAFAISIPIALVTRWAYLCWAALPVFMSVVHHLATRRQARRRPA